MANLKRKKFFSLILLLVLLISIPLGIYLVRQQQSLKSKAQTTGVINVSNSNELITAISNVQPGDTIVVADGTYTHSSFFHINNKLGTLTQPITIKSENRLGAVITGPAYFLISNSSYITIEGFLFNNQGPNSIRLSDANNIRITRNKFDQMEINDATNEGWISITGANPGINSHHNRIVHNSFTSKEKLGKVIFIKGISGMTSQHDLIDHNHFYDIDPNYSSSGRRLNGKEAITVGGTQTYSINSNTIIESNLFERYNAEPEIVSIKSGGNVVRFNTFKDSEGSLVGRFGNNNSFYGNFFIGGWGGVRVYGEGHKIYNNYFEGLTGDGTADGTFAAISIGNGSIDPIGEGTYYFRPKRILIANNTLVDNTKSINIGFGLSGASLPPSDLVFSNNLVTGSIDKLITVVTDPVNTLWEGNIMYPTGSGALGISPTPSGIIALDPRLTFLDGLQKLSNDSPAINSGVDAEAFIDKDIDGQTRNTPIDIGADEYSTEAVKIKLLTASDVGVFAADSVEESPTPTPTSSNNPGIGVGVILQYFGQQGNASQGDQNNDRRINEIDFGAVYSR